MWLLRCLWFWFWSAEPGRVQLCLGSEHLSSVSVLMICCRSNEPLVLPSLSAFICGALNVDQVFLLRWGWWWWRQSKQEIKHVNKWKLCSQPSCDANQMVWCFLRQSIDQQCLQNKVEVWEKRLILFTSWCVHWTSENQVYCFPFCS